MTALEVGTYVQIKRRAVTSADVKSRLYVQHFAGIAGEIERLCTDDNTCIIKADQDMLPLGIAKRHTEFYEGDTKGYGGMKGYPVLVSTDDVEQVTKEEARNPMSVFPIVESWANKVGIPIVELNRDIGDGLPEDCAYKQLVSGKNYRCALKFSVLAVNMDTLFNTAKELKDLHGITDAVFVCCTVRNAKTSLYEYTYYLMVCDPEPVKKPAEIIPDHAPVVELETAPEPLSGARRTCNDAAETPDSKESAPIEEDEEDFDTFLANLMDDDSEESSPEEEKQETGDDASEEDVAFFFVEE